MPTIRHAALSAALLLLSLDGGEAQAAEVQFEGFYQARGRLFDTLSLDRELAASEGLSWYMQHRLWLKPKFLLSDQVALMVEMRGLDNVYWGTTPRADTIPVVDAPLDLFILTDTLTPPTSGTDPTASFFDLTLSRAWGEVHTNVGTFKFGRQPLHWGLGLWQNDGLAVNTEYGDSADRLSWEHVVTQIWIRLAADINSEGLIRGTDDTTSFNASVAYRTERIEGGVNLQYRRSTAGPEPFDLFTADAAFDLEFGPIHIDGEVVGQFGRGAIDEFRNDVRLTSVGAVLDLGLELDKVDVGLQGGLATGDGDLDDNRVKTFTFDRDFNVGLFMFEQPMPVLASSVVADDDPLARDYDATLTGNAVSNALYLRPSVSYEFKPGLKGSFSFLTARTAKVPEAYLEQSRQGYGYEFGLGVSYEGIEHLYLGADVGAFIPGSYYRNYEVDPYSGFGAPAFGGQLLTRIHF